MTETDETIQTGIVRRGNEVLFSPEPDITHKFFSEGMVDLSGTESDGVFLVEAISTADLSQVDER